MPRVKITIEYDGTDFHGWQFQPDVRTVQDEIQKVLTRRFGRATKITGSGRTDRGVHAVGQAAHSDIPDAIDLVQLKRSINAMLPRDIIVRSLEDVSDSFNARYDAVSRTYRYEIRLQPTALESRYCWICDGYLDIGRMQSSLKTTLGTHNFEPFAKLATKRQNYQCTVFNSEIRENPGRVTILIRADRFLHGMVRAIVGTLVHVGLGVHGEKIFLKIIESGERNLVSELAPPQGLFLDRVDY